MLDVCASQRRLKLEVMLISKFLNIHHESGESTVCELLYQNYNTKLIGPPTKFYGFFMARFNSSSMYRLVTVEYVSMHVWSETDPSVN